MLTQKETIAKQAKELEEAHDTIAFLKQQWEPQISKLSDALIELTKLNKQLTDVVAEQAKTISELTEKIEPTQN